MLLCSICEEEVPFHTGSKEQDIVCKSCVRVHKDSTASKAAGLDTLQTVFDKSLEIQPKGLIEMKRLKLYCNFARDKVVMFDDVVVRFDENGNGATPEHNRSKITKFMKQRPGRVSIVEDAPKQVLVEAEKEVEVAVIEPLKEEPTEASAPEVSTEVEALEETTEPPKKRGRKPKKSTED